MQYQMVPMQMMQPQMQVQPCNQAAEQVYVFQPLLPSNPARAASPPKSKPKAETTTNYMSAYGGRYQPKPRDKDRVITPTYQSREPTRTPRSNQRQQSSGLDISVAEGRGTAQNLQWTGPKERINVMGDVQYPRSTGIVDVTSDVSNSRVNESYRTYTRNAESVYPYSNRGGRASAHYPSNFNSYRGDAYYRGGDNRASVNGSCTQS